MVRISLIIAILAGIAALAVSQLMVAEKIKTLTSDLETTKQSLSASKEAERKASKEAKEALTAAEKAKRELDTTKNDLAAASEKADQQEKRANDLAARLEKTTQERNDSQAEVARGRASGLSLEQITVTLADNKKLTAENNALKGENKVLGLKA